MNKEDLIKKLDNLDLPEIELQNHRRRLKMALLNSGYWKGERTIMSLLKKQIVPFSGFIAIVAIIIVFSIVFKSATLPVSAQELAQKSYDKVASLSPEQQEALKKTTGALDARDLLEEALSAEDLKVLTYDEFASQYPPVPPDQEGKLRTLMFLRFTHSNGLTVILGIDRNFLPAFCTAMMFGPVRGGGENEPESGERGFDVGFEGANEGPSTAEVINGEKFINGVKVTSQE
jgi:hypothetical protein